MCTASQRAGSSVADPADDGKVRSRRRAKAASPCFPTLGLAQVSLTARPRARSVLLCVPMRRASRPWRSLTSGCTLCVAGGYQTLPLKLLSMAATWQRLAAAWRRAGARGARRGAIVVGACTGAGPCSRSGRLWIVEPAALGCLAGPPGQTTELGDLWSPCESSRVCV